MPNVSSHSHDPSQDNGSSQRNLHRLVWLRGFGITMEALLIGVAVWWLNLSLPLAPLALLLAAHSVWNGYTAWRSRQARDVSDDEFFLQLFIDVLALTGVLYFVGGATNPFAWFYLLPLTIAATLLPRPRVWALALLTITCYSLLMRYHLPFSLAASGHHSDFTQHVFGMWFGFMLSAGLVAYFVTTMASSLRERDRVLAEAREQALRDERLVALGTLAAGAAHELGTPLNTMAIVSDELKQQYPAQRNAKLHEQLTLISDQIKRCKEALSVISASAGELRADAGLPLPVDHYLQQLLQQWQKERPGVPLHIQLDGSQPAPRLIADRALDQALYNILNNAADASPQWVSVIAQWTPHALTLAIRDRGPGLKAAAKNRVGKIQYSDKDHGMGLGLFLAHSVINRLGGKVVLFNNDECPGVGQNHTSNKGTCTQLILPLGDSAATGTPA